MGGVVRNCRFINSTVDDDSSCASDLLKRFELPLMCSDTIRMRGFDTSNHITPGRYDV